MDDGLSVLVEENEGVPHVQLSFHQPQTGQRVVPRWVELVVLHAAPVSKDGRGVVIRREDDGVEAIIG